jgi:hypothetical protein
MVKNNNLKRMNMKRTIKKYQNSGKPISAKPKPTYKNLRMGAENEYYEVSGERRDVKPTSRDSANYRVGFERGLRGEKEYRGEPNVEKMGRWEGQNVGKQKNKQKMGGVTKKKLKMGGAVKKGDLVAAGVTKTTKKAPMVDPKGAFTKVQQRTLGNMKKGGKMSKKK